MVKKGFLNLPQDKKQQIFDAALDEFSKKDFFSASLNNIIKKAGISKGSMYHYFRDKEDLYMYILETGIEEKKKFLAECMKNYGKTLNNMGIWEMLDFQLNTIDASIENPVLMKLNDMMERLENTHNKDFKNKIMNRLGFELENYFDEIVNRALERGEIRRDFDKDFVLRLFKFIFSNVRDILPDTNKLLKSDRGKLKQEFQQLLDFLKNGLKPKDRNSEKGDESK